MRTAVLPLLLAIACNPPPEAPGELDDLSRYLFASWSDEAAATAGLDTLQVLLDDVDLDDDDVDDRSFLIGPIGADALLDVEHPARDPDDTVGVGVGLASPWPVADHARLQTEDDQLPWEISAVAYERTFVEPEDPSCFADGSCDIMRTENLIERSSIALKVEYLLFKDFRWIEITGGQRAFFSRSWCDRVWEGENGSSSVLQSYSLDVWLPPPTGEGCWRYQVVWSEVEVLGGSEAAVATTIKRSTNEILEAGDVWIEELYH